MESIVPITVSYGDTKNPEIMNKVLYILKELKVPIRIELVEINKSFYAKTYIYGLTESAFETLSRTKALLKSFTTTPPPNFKNLSERLIQVFKLECSIVCVQDRMIAFFDSDITQDILIKKSKNYLKTFNKQNLIFYKTEGQEECDVKSGDFVVSFKEYESELLQKFQSNYNCFCYINDNYGLFEIIEPETDFEEFVNLLRATTSMLRHIKKQKYAEIIEKILINSLLGESKDYNILFEKILLQLQ